MVKRNANELVARNGQQSMFLTLDDVRQLQSGGKINFNKTIRTIKNNKMVNDIANDVITLSKSAPVKKFIGKKIDSLKPQAQQLLMNKLKLSEDDALDLTNLGRNIVLDKTGYGIQSAGKFNFGKTMKKVMKNPIVKTLGTQAINAAVPLATASLGTATGNPVLASAITGMARKEVKNQTGMGIGKYKKKAPAKSGDKRARRGQLISHLMKSEGMTLAEASKYIKENNIEY